MATRLDTSAPPAAPARESPLQWVRRTARDPLARDLAETYLARFMVLALQAVIGILVTRALGPAGRGQFATAVALGGLGVQFGLLGLQSANTYFAAREPASRRQLFGNALAAGLALGICGMAIGWGINDFLLSTALGGLVLLFALIQIPGQNTLQLLQSLLLGMGSVRRYNLLEVLSGLVQVAALGAMLLAGRTSVETVLAAGLLAVTLTLGAAVYNVRRTAGAAQFDAAVFRRCLPYGLKAYLACLLMFAVLRIDVLMLEAYAGMSATGQYAVAVSIADLILLVPQLLGTIIFPRLAKCQEPRARWQLARRAVWLVLLGSVPACTAAYVFAPGIVQILFGSQFLPAIDPLRALLPGILALAVNSILMQYLAARGMPWFTVICPVLGCLANGVINLWLIPRFGATGAAISSTISYGLMLTATLAYLSRSSAAAAREPVSLRAD